MIEIDYTLLSKQALENLITDIITRQTTDYGDFEIDIEVKKKQLMSKLISGNAVVVYSAKEEHCDIISSDQFKSFTDTF